MHGCIYSRLNFHLRFCVCGNIFFRYGSGLVFLAVAVARRSVSEISGTSSGFRVEWRTAGEY